MDHRSAQGEKFAENIKEIHEQVKKTLQQNNEKYKALADKIRSEVHYKVGDLVLAYLRKDGLPKGQPSKLCMEKIGPLKVMYKFGNNAYELELPLNLGISPIFNVCDLYPYKGSQTTTNQEETSAIEYVEWLKDLSPSQPVTLECILDSKVVKKTRKGVYKDYPIKWIRLPESEATWMLERDILQHGTIVQALSTQET
ncbi:uncharacterized protein LOC131858543 [Cryptomeria japonica]|uniref:uncharacterized protein LOC131858543 n=1 Tax=Cryptomeria japonica TaxID=3369 RepID=UPI0027DA0A13|nr:uncharacterized protein LOC131858543 [Cryptomeria japonica]